MEQAQSKLVEVNQLIAQHKYNDAIEVLKKAIPIAEEEGDWESYVDFLNLYSECLRSNGHNDESANKAEEALSVCLDKLGEQSLYFPKCHISIGLAFQSKGQFNQAVNAYETALLVLDNPENTSNKIKANCYTNLGICFANTGKFDIALEYFNKAMEIYHENAEEFKLIIADHYSNIGLCYSYLNKLELAIEFLEKAVKINKDHFKEDNVTLAKYYNNLSSCNLMYGDYSKAKDYSEKSIIIWQHKLGKSHIVLASGYGNLGLCYQKTGDYELACNCFLKELAIRSLTVGNDHIYAAITYYNLGLCYQTTKKYTLAKYYLELSLKLKLKFYGKQNIHTAVGYHGLAELAMGLKDFQSCFNNINEALTIRLEVCGKTHTETAMSYLPLGNYYKNTGIYDKALECYLEYLAININVYGEVNPETVIGFSSIASYYRLLEDVPNALNNIQKALHALGLSVSLDDYYALPELRNFNSLLYFFDTLYIKAYIFTDLFQQSQKPEDLAASLAHFYCTDQLIDLMRQSYKTEGSKLTLAGKSKVNAYDEGLFTSWMAEQLIHKIGQETYSKQVEEVNHAHSYALPHLPIQTAFHFSEKSKGILLHASMKDAEARITAGLPAELLQQEYDLRIELTFLEQRLMEEMQKPDEQQNKTNISNWEERQFDCREQYQSLIDLFETDYPAYYHLKHDLKVADIVNIQAALPPQTGLISYVVSDKYLYSIVITAKSANWLQQDLPADFESLVEDLLFSFEPYSKEDYITYAHDMYRILLQPLEQNGWLDGIGRLVIIPDGILSRIPFEALLTQTTSAATPYNQLHYLLHCYVISYHYSATLWLGQQTKVAVLPKSEVSFLGFAPVYSDNIQLSKDHDLDLSLDDELLANLDIELEEVSQRTRYTESEGVTRGKVEGKEYAELLYTEKEVQQAGRAFAENGHASRVLLHQSATLDAFKQLAGRYRYLLIAAHADMDDEHPEQTGIIFSPNEGDGKGIFYMGDAYNLPLTAELVVLSCCESGLGKITKGEGTMALNRGFLYAGAKNVVYTLFKVYDKESCELTTVFFQQLLTGLSCTEALHSAKLQLVKQKLMPLKWAGYVLVGEKGKL